MKKLLYLLLLPALHLPAYAQNMSITSATQSSSQAKPQVEDFQKDKDNLIRLTESRLACFKAALRMEEIHACYKNK